MREVGAFEAKTKLGTLLDWVDQGEEILITRRGIAVAKLVPARPGADQAKISAAVAGLRQTRKSARLGPDSLKALVEMGRP